MPKKEIRLKWILESRCGNCGKPNECEFLTCSECRQRNSDYKNLHPEIRERELQHLRIFGKNLRESTRKEILELLGNKCSNLSCPIPEFILDLRALDIDHVNGKGTQERNQFSTSIKYYKFILKKIKEGSKDYQLLCAYCNRMKRIEKRENRV